MFTVRPFKKMTRGQVDKSRDDVVELDGVFGRFLQTESPKLSTVLVKKYQKIILAKLKAKKQYGLALVTQFPPCKCVQGATCSIK